MISQSPFSKRLPAWDTRDEYARLTFFRSVFSECLSRACWSSPLEALRLASWLFFRLKAFKRDRQLSYVSRSAETLSPKPISSEKKDDQQDFLSDIKISHGHWFILISWEVRSRGIGRHLSNPASPRSSVPFGRGCGAYAAEGG